MCRLYWRGFRAPQYRKRWRERLAIYHTSTASPVIWIHSVSLGETESVLPLLRQLQNIYHNDNFLLTTTTPTGAAAAKAVLGDRLQHLYLPYDLPSVIKRFLTTLRPKIALMVEKEIWPNLYAQCRARAIPVVIINARLSANSAKNYQKIPSLIKPALASTSCIATQTAADRDRFIAIGAPAQSVVVLGNIKFDTSRDPNHHLQALAIKQSQFNGRFVLLAASTHDGEERLFLDIYQQLKPSIPELLLIIAPRHPERFATVAKLAQNMHLSLVRRALSAKCTNNSDVYLADTMGELKMLYGTADVSFVGGSMAAIGGHNVLEAAVMQSPILFGPNMHNFQHIATAMLANNAAIQCADKAQIIAAVRKLYTDTAYKQQLLNNADHFVASNQGASHKTINKIQQLLQK